MEETTSITDVVKRIEQYEETVSQLIRIVGVSNKKIIELNEKINYLENNR